MAAFIALPGFPAFAHQKPDDPERGHRIDPPQPGGGLRKQRRDDDEAKPAASDALHCIGAERAAAERVGKTSIRSPQAGTVLVTYAKAGEFVQPGQPILKLASLDAVDVRAYVTETQLASVKVGQAAQVTFDAGRGRQSVSGNVSWTSAQAEFTPTPIQTRDERADLVYAVKIRVPNNGGALKIGMPVDVMFAPGTGR